MEKAQEQNKTIEKGVEQTQGLTNEKEQGLLGAMYDGLTKTPIFENTLEFEKLGEGKTVFDDLLENTVNGAMQMTSDTLGSLVNRTGNAMIAGMDHAWDKMEGKGKMDNHEQKQEVLESKEQKKDVKKEQKESSKEAEKAKERDNEQERER